MFAALVLFAAARAADANLPHDHQGVAPAYKGAPAAVPLAADEAAKLAAGELVLKQVKSGNGGRGVVFMDIAAAPQTIWSRITNYGMYPTWVDNVAACEVYRKDGATIFTRFVLDPMGMNVEYFIKHTYNPTAGWLTWTLDYSRLSDLDESIGYWRVTPLTTEPPRTRLEYSVDVRFKGWVPGFAQDMIAKHGLTNAVAWVKKQSEGG
ncbi:MAG: SRPBCC family protein [Pseudomonadota bacterium]|nr:SRPBCC family protein [Pseudomonadota bacterium]